METTSYLNSDSPANLQGLLSVPPTTGYDNVLNKQLPSLDQSVERLRMLSGFVSLRRLKDLTEGAYPEDGDLAFWLMRGLLRDRTYYELCHLVAGRDYRLDVRHIQTRQTREEWVCATGDLASLQNPELWVVSIDSLKRQYHRLYVHWIYDNGINICQDKPYKHREYVSPSGYDTDMRHISTEVLDQQANRQGINACFYSVLQEWVLLYL